MPIRVIEAGSEGDRSMLPEMAHESLFYCLKGLVYRFQASLSWLGLLDFSLLL